jgi:ribonuclease BN (tRNA processing enzyme)
LVDHRGGEQAGLEERDRAALDRRNRVGLTLTVLGATSPYPGPGEACPGYLIEGFGTRILLECGSGVMSRLQQYCDFTEIDAIILSHLHFDHCSDLLVLRYALDAAARSGRLLEPVPVHCPSQPAEVADLVGYKAALAAVPIRPVVGGPTPSGELPVSVTIGGLATTFLSVKHPVEAYGVVLRPDKAPAVGSLFFYTGDTEWMEDLPKRVGRCEIVLAEATYAAKQAPLGPVFGHLTIGQAARLGGMTEARSVILTHHPPGRREETVRAEARRALARSIIVATEGFQLQWP